MKRIIEEVQKIQVGDIILLSKTANSFNNPVARHLVDTSHMFVVVGNNPITICSISSNMEQLRHSANIELLDYKVANLRKPSFVSTNTYGAIDISQIYKIVGRISNDDLLRVVRSYRSQEEPHVKLEKLS